MSAAEPAVACVCCMCCVCPSPRGATPIHPRGFEQQQQLNWTLFPRVFAISAGSSFFSLLDPYQNRNTRRHKLDAFEARHHVVEAKSAGSRRGEAQQPCHHHGGARLPCGALACHRRPAHMGAPDHPQDIRMGRRGHHHLGCKSRLPTA